MQRRSLCVCGYTKTQTPPRLFLLDFSTKRDPSPLLRSSGGFSWHTAPLGPASLNHLMDLMMKLLLAYWGGQVLLPSSSAWE